MTTIMATRAKEQARVQMEIITEMVNALEAGEGEEYEGQDPSEAIREHPLEVLVRSDWYSSEERRGKPSEFLILLCTGGPAVRIVGNLDEHGQPTTAKLEYQDWFTPWESYPISEEEEAILMCYASRFYFGE